MGKYHNKLDKKYFNKSIYIKKFEEVFNIKIKDYSIQYEIILDTFNTLISFNNILFSTNYMKTSDRIDNSIHLISSYLNKYKNKINKCYDLNCINIYQDFESDLEELKEMKKPNVKVNLNSIKSNMEFYMSGLDILCFDLLFDNKELVYQKLPNDKLPKKINCKIITNLDTTKSLLFSYDEQKKYNDIFINDYYNKTNIDLNNDVKSMNMIFELHTFIKDVNNAIVDRLINNDHSVFKIHLDVFNSFVKNDYTYLKDIYYQNLFNKIKDIIIMLNEDKIDLAYQNIKAIIEQYKNIYERIS